MESFVGGVRANVEAVEGFVGGVRASVEVLEEGE